MSAPEPTIFAPTPRLLSETHAGYLIGRCGPLSFPGFLWHLVRWERATTSPNGYWTFVTCVPDEPYIRRRWGYVAACGTRHMGALYGFTYGIPNCSKCLNRLIQT